MNQRPFTIFDPVNPNIRIGCVYASSVTEALALAKQLRAAGPAPILKDEEADARRLQLEEQRHWDAVWKLADQRR